MLKMITVFLGLALLSGSSLAQLNYQDFWHPTVNHRYPQYPQPVNQEPIVFPSDESLNYPSQQFNYPGNGRFPLFSTQKPDSSFLVSSGFDGGSEFAGRLYREIARTHRNGNLLVSPFSAYLALMMTSYGARGNTEHQMAKILNRPETAVIRSVFPKTLDLLKGLRGIELNVANTILVSKNIGLKEKFKQMVQSLFQSSALEVDASNGGRVAQAVNNWIDNQTRHKINNVVNKDDIIDSAVILINAIYFSGQWDQGFQKTNTGTRKFYTSISSSRVVPTMRLLGKFLEVGSIPEIDAHFVVLPYVDKDFEMVFVIPNTIGGLAKIEANAHFMRYELLKTRREKDNVNLELPKFRIESKLKLNDILVSLGMTEAFNNYADFSAMTDNGPLKISQVLQKTYVEIDEKGTEAAAATVVNPVPYSFVNSRNEPRLVKVDRPSFFMINYKNINLFSGRLQDP